MCWHGIERKRDSKQRNYNTKAVERTVLDESEPHLVGGQNELSAVRARQSNTTSRPSLTCASTGYTVICMSEIEHISLQILIFTGPVLDFPRPCLCLSSIANHRSATCATVQSFIRRQAACLLSFATVNVVFTVRFRGFSARKCVYIGIFYGAMGPHWFLLCCRQNRLDNLILNEILKVLWAFLTGIGPPCRKSSERSPNLLRDTTSSRDNLALIQKSSSKRSISTKNMK